MKGDYSFCSFVHLLTADVEAYILIGEYSWSLFDALAMLAVEAYILMGDYSSNRKVVAGSFAVEAFILNGAYSMVLPYRRTVAVEVFILKDDCSKRMHKKVRYRA